MSRSRKESATAHMQVVVVRYYVPLKSLKGYYMKIESHCPYLCYEFRAFSILQVSIVTVPKSPLFSMLHECRKAAEFLAECRLCTNTDLITDSME
jgi:hypothetical protein